MDIPVALCITMLAYLYGTIFRKPYSKQFPNKMARHGYNTISSFVATIVLLFWGGIGNPSGFTILLAVVFGLITALCQVATLKALEFGAVSYTTVMISLSTLIPALSGVLIWREELGGAQIVGMALLVVCLFLSVDFRDKNKKGSFSWLFYCLIAFLCTGAIGVMQKIHQMSNYKAEVNAFLMIAFLCSFLCSGILFVFGYAKHRKDAVAEKKNVAVAKWWLWGVLLVISGFASALNNKLNLILSGLMDSAVFFPLVNGGGLILTTLTGVIFFKEKLSVLQWIGVFVGISSVVLLCNPFV